MIKALEILKEHKSTVLYLIFGVCSTVLNMIVYYLCYDIIGINNIVSTALAWIMAIVFAFITNKQLVFGSVSWDFKTLQKEVVKFTGCRVATGLLDIVFMYITVDLLSFNALIMKFISNIIVVVLNYIASKLIIFTNKKENVTNEKN